MNKRRQSFNWFRIILLMLLIAAGLYIDRVVLPATPSPFESTPTPTRPPESFLTEAQTLFEAGKLTQSIQAYEQGIAAQPNDPTSYVALAQVQVFAGDYKGAQASADADHDGASNLAEWVAGTNPTNAASCLRLAAPSVNGPNGIIIRWPSVAGKTYRLERATDLLTGLNAVVRSNISATPPTNSEPDATTLSSKARYYRIRVEE